jgi:hypothetical protein
MRKRSEVLIVVEELMAVGFSFTKNSPGIFNYELRNLIDGDFSHCYMLLISTGDFEIVKEGHTVLAVSVYDIAVCLS